MRGLSEYRIRAADSISPPLASGSVSGSVSTRILLRSPSRPSARVPPGFWMLDPGICGRLGVYAEGSAEGSGPPGFWILESVGGWVGCACGPWILDAGICGRLGPVWAARILDSGYWKLGCRRVEGCGPPGFCILQTGNWAVGGRVDGCGPPGFWILDSGNWGGRGGQGRAHSVFCILYSAGDMCM